MRALNASMSSSPIDDLDLPAYQAPTIANPAIQEKVACFEALDKLLKEHYTGPPLPNLINPAPPPQPSDELPALLEDFPALFDDALFVDWLALPPSQPGHGLNPPLQQQQYSSPVQQQHSAPAQQPTPLEFDPPLSHYAEPRGGLPLGYIWIPPGSVEPVRVDPEFVPYVPEDDVDAEGETDHSALENMGLEVRLGKDGKRKLRWIEVTPERIANMPTRHPKKAKMEEKSASVKEKQPEGSPSSSVLSSAPSGLLTPDAA
jgi:hypothetical protein